MLSKDELRLKIHATNFLSFQRKVKTFCSDKNIEISIKNFLSFKSNKENQTFPDNFSYILSGSIPVLLVAFSSEYGKLYRSLDVDLRKDLDNAYSILEAKMFVSLNTDRRYKKLIKKFLGDDYTEM